MGAILGAATALAGLLVVFEGFLINTYASFKTSTAKRPYLIATWGVVAIILLSMAVSLGAIATLVGKDLLWPTIYGFTLAIVLVMVGSIIVAKLTLD